MTLMFIALATLCSFVIMVFSIGNSSVRFFNTWQFPMLLALLLDGIFVLGNEDQKVTFPKNLVYQ